MSEHRQSERAPVPISVIIPCFNAAGTIERALSSVLGQTVLPREIILIDDASEDNGKTAQKLQELKERYGHVVRIETISLPTNGGPATARNAGWDTATQPYIAFLDADDAWHPLKLAVQYAWMDDHPLVALSGHPCVQLLPGQPMPVLPQTWRAHRTGKTHLLFSNRFQTPSVMLRRNIPFRFRQGMKYCEDYLLWQQIVFSGHEAYRLDLPLAFLFKPPFGEGGLSRNLWQLSKGEMTTFTLIRAEGLISNPTRMFITAYIFLKYIRRLFISLLSGRLFFGKPERGKE